MIDNLERALQAAGLDPEGDSAEALAQGFSSSIASLRDALAKPGSSPSIRPGRGSIRTGTRRFPTQPVEGAESGVVVETMQKGYRLGEQLIRPARVVVAE